MPGLKLAPFTTVAIVGLAPPDPPALESVRVVV